MSDRPAWVRPFPLRAVKTETDESSGRAEPAPEQLVRLTRLAMIGELVACFTHEVSNPLMLVQGHLRLIAEDLPPGHPSRESVEAARAAADRIGSIASRMLHFSRNEPVKNDRCDLRQIVEDAFSFVRPSLNLQGVSFEVRVEPDVEPVSSDANLLIQVLVNLFRNAGDAMVRSSERRLGVKISAREEAVRIAVSDSGPGIAPADRGRIFEPFYTTKGEQGTGLGLYITRRIVVDQLKGSLSVTDESGRTTFAIDLPR